jgi:hypothetical protein
LQKRKLAAFRVVEPAYLRKTRKGSGDSPYSLLGCGRQPAWVPSTVAVSILSPLLLMTTHAEHHSCDESVVVGDLDVGKESMDEGYGHVGRLWFRATLIHIRTGDMSLEFEKFTATTADARTSIGRREIVQTVGNEETHNILALG